ncbi:EXO5 (predicted) [Pycnogonum litorale]
MAHLDLNDLWNDGITDEDVLAAACFEEECSNSTSVDVTIDERTNEKCDENFLSSSGRQSGIDIPSRLKHYNRRYLCVTDLTSQLWCEQKMVYSYEVPLPVVIKKDTVVKGVNLHLKRELEVHDLHEVHITSKEDKFALKVINLLDSVKRLQNGVSVCREVPVFGIPFGCNLFITGVIDEIRYDTATSELEIVELKTRSSSSKPGSSIQRMNDFQVMLYKLMFDDLILNKIQKEDIAAILNLNLQKKFGEDIKKNVANQNIVNLDRLLSHLFDTMSFSTSINRILIDYVSQDDEQTMSLHEVQFNLEWLEKKFKYFVEFWNGNRNEQGVDIEDAWKCNICDYRRSCAWRASKSEDCIRSNETSPVKRNQFYMQL